MTLPVLRLPQSLEPSRASIERALATPFLGEWPEGEGLALAEQPEAIAKVLIRKLHDHLVPARIAFVFRKEMKRGDVLTLGKAKKAAAMLVFLAEVDFLIVFNWTVWRTLEPHQRVALVDHELCHCILNSEKGKWATAHHDVEEFGGVIRRWGEWKPDLEAFAEALAEQAELFPNMKLMKAVAQLAPAPGSGIESVTLSTEEHSVTLTTEDGDRMRRSLELEGGPAPKRPRRGKGLA